MRYAAALGLSAAAALVVIAIPLLADIATDADSTINTTGIAQFFAQLPTLAGILGVGALGAGAIGLLVSLVRRVL